MGIQTANEAFSVYDRILDQVVPWKEFNETLIELDKYREDYSTESATLIGDIKTRMMNGIDAYAEASQSVYEWASLVVPLLKAYLTLFDGYNPQKAHAQKTILLKILDEGMAKMNAAQDKLSISSSSFNSAAGKLTSLHSQFVYEFDEKSDFVQNKIFKIRVSSYSTVSMFGIAGLAIAAGVIEGKIVPELSEKFNSIKRFYDNLKSNVDKAYKDIDEAKRILKREIQHIGDLKIQTEGTKTFLDLDEVQELRDTITTSIQELITKCNEYRKRHINNNKE